MNQWHRANTSQYCVFAVQLPEEGCPQWRRGPCNLMHQHKATAVTSGCISAHPLRPLDGQTNAIHAIYIYIYIYL